MSKEKVKFGIQTSSKMFAILSDKLYSNKIKSVIRELSCNAVDANTDNEIFKPITVALPNKTSPIFSVKDNGRGLTRNQIKTIYTQYGSSTKGHKDNQTGKLGLGSKSPFAYTKEFYCTSTTLNRVDKYKCYMDGDGEPTLVLVEESLNENELPTGLEVSFKVDEEDFDSFCNYAKEVYTYFTTKPEVNGNINYKLTNEEIIYKKDNEYSIVHSHSDSVCVQANIAYPININQIKKHLSKSELYILEIYARKAILYFKNGELDVSASREELSYDELTIKNIVTKIKKYNRDIINETKFKINSFNTKYEALEYLASFQSKYLVASNTKFKYNGVELENHITIKDTTTILYYPSGNNIKRELVELYCYNSNDVFIFDDTNKKTSVSIAREYSNKHNARVYLFKDLEFINTIGNPPYKFASNMSLTKKPKQTNKGAFFKQVSSFSGQPIGNFTSADNLRLDLDKKFYYIDYSKCNLSNNEIRNMLELFEEILGFKDSVYMIKASHFKTSKFKSYDAIEIFTSLLPKLKSNKKYKKYMSDYKLRRITNIQVSDMLERVFMNTTFEESINKAKDSKSIDFVKTLYNRYKKENNYIYTNKDVVIDKVGSTLDYNTHKRVEFIRNKRRSLINKRIHKYCLLLTCMDRYMSRDMEKMYIKELIVYLENK